MMIGSWLRATKVGTGCRFSGLNQENPRRWGQMDTESRDGDEMKIKEKYINKSDSKSNYRLNMKQINTMVIKYWIEEE